MAAAAAVDANFTATVKGNSTTSTVTPAATATDGSLLELVLMTDSLTGTVTPPSGFTIRRSVSETNGDTGCTITLMTKTAGASEPSSYTVTWDFSEASVLYYTEWTNHGGFLDSDFTETAGTAAATLAMGSIDTDFENTTARHAIVTDRFLSASGGIISPGHEIQEDNTGTGANDINAAISERTFGPGTLTGDIVFFSPSDARAAFVSWAIGPSTQDLGTIGGHTVTPVIGAITITTDTPQNLGTIGGHTVTPAIGSVTLSSGNLSPAAHLVEGGPERDVVVDNAHLRVRLL